MEKLHRDSDWNSIQAHLDRKNEESAPKCDTTKTHLNSQYDPVNNSWGNSFNILERIDQRKTDLKCMETRGKNKSVICNNLIVSASPTFFRENGGDWGKVDYQEKLEQWTQRNVKYFKEKYGDNFISATLHLDEATPHLHVFITPMEEITRKKKRSKADIAANKPNETFKAHQFNGKKLFNQSRLLQLQDEYPAYFDDMGLKRGKKGSDAKHIAVKDYYKDVGSVQMPEAIKQASEAFRLDNKIPLMGKEKWLEKENKRIETHYKRLQIAAKKAINQNHNNMKQLKNENIAKKDLKEQNNNLNLQNKGLKRSEDLFKNRIERLNGAVETLEQDLDDTRRAFTESKARANGLTAKIKELQEKYEPTPVIDRNSHPLKDSLRDRDRGPSTDEDREIKPKTPSDDYERQCICPYDNVS